MHFPGPPAQGPGISLDPGTCWPVTQPGRNTRVSGHHSPCLAELTVVGEIDEPQGQVQTQCGDLGICDEGGAQCTEDADEGQASERGGRKEPLGDLWAPPSRSERQKEGGGWRGDAQALRTSWRRLRGSA